MSLTRFSGTRELELTYEYELSANLKSLETYIFMGFNEDTASTLWKRYLSSSGPLKVEFLECALNHVGESSATDASSASDDWEACLAALGINPDTQRSNSQRRL
jgi:hypothetical protein